MNIQVSYGSLWLAFNENSYISLIKQEFYLFIMDQYVSVLLFFFFYENARTVNFYGYSLSTEGEFLTRPVMQESLFDELCGLRQIAVWRSMYCSCGIEGQWHCSQDSDTVLKIDCFISLKSWGFSVCVFCDFVMPRHYHLTDEIFVLEEIIRTSPSTKWSIPTATCFF